MGNKQFSVSNIFPDKEKLIAIDNFLNKLWLEFCFDRSFFMLMHDNTFFLKNKLVS